jgi:hypothetical protein
MLRRAVLTLALAASLAATASAATKPAKAVTKRPVTPVLVELYTAQGCSSCSKADEIVGDLASRPDVLPLTFAVDYWDYLGWADTFAKPAFAERQRAYARKLTVREVYTPQVVIDGAVQAGGGHPEQVSKLVAAAVAKPHDPPHMLFRDPGRVAVGSGKAPRGGADVWLIRYDPHDQEVAVRRGDNKGQTLTQHNVVRQVVRLGGWSGKPILLKMPPVTAKDELSTVVVVQGAKGGKVIGVLVEEKAPPASS